ncbi:MAG: carboxypeptidase regulatory-like domain-containing protein [Flavobacteriales bacterium]|nr:MAG: carboxypeptidase regulatory-like domain-containing protein [Flavobacteriales bacterium]
MRRSLLFLHLLLPFLLAAQTATVSGTVRDDENRPLPDASIAVVGQAATSSNATGGYSIIVPAEREIVLRFAYPGAETVERTLKLKAGETRSLDVMIRSSVIGPVTVTDDRLRDAGIDKLNARTSHFQPSLGDVNSLLQGSLGVMTRNELSSGYNVRGGNFDENLVYVNGIEVYRPFLVRSGQQEGLSFPNPDMIERIHFSAGGWEPRYGDKLSSVLDITYKRPREFDAIVSASLLGGSVTVGSAMAHQRLRQITGFRYRTLSTILKGLDTKGDYVPTYTDLQSYWTYDLSDKVEIGFLGLYSRNRYDVTPQDRETELGNFNQALRYTVYFEGQERTAYETWSGALSLTARPSPRTVLKFTGSAFNTYETERMDILGEYRLGELDRNLASEQFGEVVRDLGIGAYLEHARNSLEATVLSATHTGSFFWGRGNNLQWGLEARTERINDRLSEWYVVDSAGYSIPQSSGAVLELNTSVKTKIDLESVRTSAYVQNAWEWKTGRDRSWALVAGVRGQNWSYNGQTVFSPRLRLAYHPGWRKVVAAGDTVPRDYSFWFATGVYYQPPFYRELRDFNGVLNPEVRAQKSIHFILGMDRQFKMWDRPFKFSTEAYYKALSDLNPYELDNVRIRYYAKNNAKGYATGIDMKLNGEFIKGVESWASLSVMQTEEDIDGDFYYRTYNAAGERTDAIDTQDRTPVDSVRVEAGHIPRPTDQRVSFALFFQDEMPRWPTFKVHLNLVFGTSLPYGPPNETRYADTLRTSLYRRVDIGFSKQFLGAPGQEKTGVLRHIKDLWLSLEVFNLINLNNTVDYTWVQDVQGRYYGIPEFLTPRRINLKLIARF